MSTDENDMFLATALKWIRNGALQSSQKKFRYRIWWNKEIYMGPSYSQLKSQYQAMHEQGVNWIVITGYQCMSIVKQPQG